MSFIAPYNTLEYQLHARPSTITIDATNAPLNWAVANVAKFLDTDQIPDTVPEHEAIKFYMLNHAVSVVMDRVSPKEELGDYLSILEAFHTYMAEGTVRAFAYLLLICTREARHIGAMSSIKKQLSTKFGISMWNFIQLIQGVGEDGAQKILMKQTPSVSLGDYCGALSLAFHNGSWKGGYGGVPWGNVADCLWSYVRGEYSAEMMMDVIWTLSHNNGPIFNKGMCYGMYNHKVIVKLLDIQRAGMIPQLVDNPQSGGVVGSFVTHEIKELHKPIIEVLGKESFGGLVDWDYVNKFGVGKKTKKATKKPKKGYMSNTKVFWDGMGGVYPILNLRAEKV